MIMITITITHHDDHHDHNHDHDHDHGVVARMDWGVRKKWGSASTKASLGAEGGRLRVFVAAVSGRRTASTISPLQSRGWDGMVHTGDGMVHTQVCAKAHLTTGRAKRGTRVTRGLREDYWPGCVSPLSIRC